MASLARSTPEEYVQRLVAVFREVRRVLRDDGTLWLNLGDTYRNKQLLGIPWRVAFALQEDDWILRGDQIWSKPNCAPESVKDRPTRSHEYIFLFTKSREYYYDHVATREPVSDHPATRERAKYRPAYPNKFASDEAREAKAKHSPVGYRSPDGKRNRRSVWTVGSNGGFKGAHFAVFPPELIEPCILSSPERVCAHCGSPWKRRMEKTGQFQRRWSEGYHPESPYQSQRGKFQWFYETKFWEPTCECPENYREARAIILDPFMGSGTTAIAAIRHRRDYLGIELNPEYVKMAKERIRQEEIRLIFA